MTLYNNSNDSHIILHAKHINREHLEVSSTITTLYILLPSLFPIYGQDYDNHDTYACTLLQGIVITVVRSLGWLCGWKMNARAGEASRACTHARDT